MTDKWKNTIVDVMVIGLLSGGVAVLFATAYWIASSGCGL